SGPRRAHGLVALAQELVPLQLAGMSGVVLAGCLNGGQR
ncbi:MAG: hypothetical protein JWR11_4323, partial [Mycobacterium sp.]|nr:hypothetical protein [Mycobacterium sp.]